MGTTNLSIRYRPLRIGFLVEEGNIDDLVKAAGINTMLWGGMYNPIIPVSKNSKHIVEELIKFFSIDMFHAVSNSPDVNDIIKEYHYLEGGSGFEHNVFCEGYYKQSETVIGYLNSIDIIDYFYYSEGLKNLSPTYKSDYSLITWDNNDKLKNLFAILYGYFPEIKNLRYDFRETFLNKLHSKIIKIKLNQSVDNLEIEESICPLLLTGLKLNSTKSSFHTWDGIYVGYADDFEDLLNFWNLRASDIKIKFLPISNIQIFEKYVKSFLLKLDNIPNRISHIKDHIGLYCQPKNFKIVKEILKNFRARKGYVPRACCWNGLNIKPANYYFNKKDITANIDKPYNRYIITMNLPDKRFLVSSSQRTEHQHLIASINTISENEYSGHTLTPPPIIDLTEFYSREITPHNPYKVRCSKTGLGVIIKRNGNLLSIYPISHEKLFNKIFESAEIRTEISQPGLLTTRIIEKLNGLDGCRIFKIRGVRRLIKSLNKDEFVTRGEATNIIYRELSFEEIELKLLLKGDFSNLINQFFNYNEKKKIYYWKKNIKNEEDLTDKRLKDLYKGDFQKFKNLFIVKRESKDLTTGAVFDFLLKKDFFRAGLSFKCDYCNLPNWLSLKKIDDAWICNYCGSENKTSLHLKNQGDWKFRKNGFFSRDNNQEGSIPVILTLLSCLRILNNPKFVYYPSLILKNVCSNGCEIDFCILQYTIEQQIQIGIGEAKSKGRRIDKKNIENMLEVRKKLEKIGLKCFLIFSKTAEKFEDKEIELFEKLSDDNIPCILLTNNELEPYHPYMNHKHAEKLPRKYSNTLHDMVENSTYLYLNNNKT